MLLSCTHKHTHQTHAAHCTNAHQHTHTQGHVKKFCETIQLEMPTTKEDVTAFKAAIWALGHIGSTQQGLELLLSENAVDDLIDLAEECPLLSIRGYTCTTQMYSIMYITYVYVQCME